MTVEATIQPSATTTVCSFFGLGSCYDLHCCVDRKERYLALASLVNKFLITIKIKKTLIVEATIPALS
jgi:hypothetical protein